MAQGQVDAALRLYDDVLALDASYTMALADRGTVYAMVKKFDFAVRDLTRAFELGYREASAFCTLATIQLEQRRQQESLAWFARAIELDSANPLAFYNRSRALFELGQHDAAIADLNRCLAFNPDGNTRAMIVRRIEMIRASAGPTSPATRSWKDVVRNNEAALQGRVAALANIPAMMTSMLPPFHPGDGLGGAVRTLAEALLLLGPERCALGFDVLMPTLPQAVRDVDPSKPGRVPTTQGLLSFIVVAQNAGALPTDAMQSETKAWLTALIARQPPADAMSRQHCGVLAAALGFDAEARTLVGAEAKTFTPGLAFDGDVARLCSYFVDAIEARAEFAAIEQAWHGFLRAAPSMLETNAINWVSVHAFARIALGRVAGVAVGELARTTHLHVFAA